MKISIGVHETLRGEAAEAWIEPNKPAFRSGAVRDHGFLCIEQGDEVLRLESKSEDAWKLVEIVDMDVARQLWAGLKEYNREPYYMAYDHGQYGRLYFTPWVAEGSEPGVAFHTRPEGRYPQEGSVLAEPDARGHLVALFTHENLAGMGGLIPDDAHLAAAVARATKTADAVMTARAAYAATVDWEFDARVTSSLLAATGRDLIATEPERKRYEVLSSWAQRPNALDVDAATPEAYRWFEASGLPRLEPLTSEALAAHLQDVVGYSPEDAWRAGQMEAVPTEDWNWYKDKRLGAMREPTEVLHDLIQQERVKPTPNVGWLEKAVKAGDFCADTPVRPSRLLDVMQGYIADVAGTDLQHRQATAAIALLRDPQAGLASDASHPASRVFGAYDDIAEASHTGRASSAEPDALDEVEDLIFKAHRAEEALVGVRQVEPDNFDLAP